MNSSGGSVIVQFEELINLQIELIKLEEYVRHNRLKMCVIFEGRDAAGKSGVSLPRRKVHSLDHAPTGARCNSGPLGRERACAGWRCGCRARLRSRRVPCLPYGGGQAAEAKTDCYRTGLPGYRQYSRHDRDRSTGVPDNVAPEDAEPDPHARR